MAEHLASIFGTEKDRVNCPFYFKIGACRHGDRCSRLHTKPSISPTLLLSNMYQRPDMITPGVDPQGQPLDPRKIQDHFEDFYEDLFEELSKYGEIESLNICDNLADHMVGNVYVQFREEEHAANALRNLSGRFYAGRPIIVDFSPVTDFREATCRQYEENICNRGGYCNFMHLKKISRELRRQLFGRNRRRRSRSRSQSPHRHRSYEERSHGGWGVQLGKAALREGQRLSNGIGKGNRQNLLARMILVTTTMIAIAFCTMENSIMTLINSSTGRSMEVMTTDQVALSGGVQVQCPVILKLLEHSGKNIHKLGSLLTSSFRYFILLRADGKNSQMFWNENCLCQCSGIPASQGCA
ncbi:hypothetical protein F0562_016829 [Nyssa sinensis]|uniref:C3H1-type domain-containing protein n=1 Tax=Nyssa sinensis TaxID=561372 RepID=A0A5J4ZDD8_9ASTE|nr:hypothetical protein F0562_016829 [Nyssa sinensis]